MVNPLRQFGLLAHIKSTVETHYIAEEVNTELSMHLVQTPAKIQLSLVRFSKASLLKSSNSNSNKNLCISQTASIKLSVQLKIVV